MTGGKRQARLWPRQTVMEGLWGTWPGEGRQLYNTSYWLRMRMPNSTTMSFVSAILYDCGYLNCAQLVLGLAGGTMFKNHRRVTDCTGLPTKKPMYDTVISPEELKEISECERFTVHNSNLSSKWSHVRCFWAACTDTPITVVRTVNQFNCIQKYWYTPKLQIGNFQNNDTHQWREAVQYIATFRYESHPSLTALMFLLDRNYLVWRSVRNSYPAWLPTLSSVQIRWPPICLDLVKVAYVSSSHSVLHRPFQDLSNLENIRWSNHFDCRFFDIRTNRDGWNAWRKDFPVWLPNELSNGGEGK